MQTLLLIILAIVVVAALWVIATYNGFIQLRVKTEEAWSDIDTQLKKRYDLIPNLVETVKGYASHEDKVFEEVTKARSQAMQATNPQDLAKAENMLSQTLKSLFAVAENYPDLKANQNFLELQQTLSFVEDDISKSRRYYNGAIKEFNTKIELFPSNIIAGFFHFGKKEFFEAEEVERANVKVSFGA